MAEQSGLHQEGEQDVGARVEGPMTGVPGRRNMANMILLYVTIDHARIVEWARRRGARPVTFDGDVRPWPLLFQFGPRPPGVIGTGWDRFFDEFERADLAFVYRDAAPEGQLTIDYEFIKRIAVPDLIFSGRSTVIEKVA
jgi:hypothetical protein